MRKRTDPQRNVEKCPITFALDIFGDKWSLIILRDIVFKGKRHYSEFLKSAEKISTNILADRLNRLERESLLTKRRDPDNQAKFVYSLTPKGQDLIPLLLEMIVWSSKYDPQPDAPSSIIYGAPDNLLERTAGDRESLIDEIIANMN